MLADYTGRLCIPLQVVAAIQGPAAPLWQPLLYATAALQLLPPLPSCRGSTTPASPHPLRRQGPVNLLLYWLTTPCI